MRKEQLVNQLSFLKAVEIMESLPSSAVEEVEREVFEWVFVTLKKLMRRHESRTAKKRVKSEMVCTS